MFVSKESEYKVMFLFFMVSLIIVLLYLVAYQFGIVQYLEDYSARLIHPTLILNAFLMLIAVYGVLVVKEKFRWTDFGLITSKILPAFVVGIITWILIQIIEGLSSYFYTGIIELDPRWSTDSLVLIGLLFGMLFGTALYEEVGYRGFLLIQFRMKMKKMTTNKTLQIVLALIISQTFFTLIHIPKKIMDQGWTLNVLLDLMFGVFLNGIIYSLLYLRTENLFFVIFVHAFGNAPTSLFISYLDASAIILLFAIFWAAVWPSLQKWGKDNIAAAGDLDSDRNYAEM